MCRALLIVLIYASTLACSLPARAEAADPVESAVNSLMARIFTESNFDLLFGLMRQGLAAAASGQAAPEVTMATAARFEAAGKDIQREMSRAAMSLLDGVEKDMRGALQPERSRP